MSIKSNKLIIFLIPPEKGVNGGILSIFSLCKESRKFHSIHKSDVVICTYPRTKSYKENNLFENNEEILDFEEITKLYPKLDSLVLHIPEYAVKEVRKSLEQYRQYLADIPLLQINILNQNIELMLPDHEVASLFSFTGFITQTTAHIKYTTQDLSNKYGIPTHLFLVSIDPEQYERLVYEEKQDIIAYSADEHPMKQAVLNQIAKKLPNYELIEVRDMSYAQFKKLASKCRFMITFGEGFDGYLIETTFSGGVTFATYNDRFFPSSDYKKLRNIYPSYEAMLEKIVSDINILEKADAYNFLNAENYGRISKIYNYKKYIKNIENFYQGKYTFDPEDGAITSLLGRSVQKKDAEIEAQTYTIAQQKAEIEAQTYTIAQQKAEIEWYKGEVQELQQTLEAITSSRSWKITKPLRKINKIKPTK